MDTPFIVVLGFLLEVRKGSFFFLLPWIFKLHVCSHLQKANEKHTDYCQCWEPAWGVEFESSLILQRRPVDQSMCMRPYNIIAKHFFQNLFFHNWSLGVDDDLFLGQWAAKKLFLLPLLSLASCSAITPRALVVFVFPFVLVLTKCLVFSRKVLAGSVKRYL